METILPDPNPNKQRQSLGELDSLFSDSRNVLVTHYSCESFYDRPEGASARITSIALRNLETGQTVSFSIHQVAERRGVKASDIGSDYDTYEKVMLDEYFEYLRLNADRKFLHWNMRDINYGFAAIEHRYRVLGGDPIIVDDRNKFDLARMLIRIYGVKYTGNPRLTTLLDQNNIKALGFMSGAQEAEAFETGNYVGLHQSTLRKVDVIANIAERSHHRTLKTNTSWWEMHGGNLRYIFEFVMNHKMVTGIIGLLGLLAAIIGLFGAL